MQNWIRHSFLLLVVLMSSLSNAKAQKPDIVLIVADYMGYADIEPFGITEIKTPSLNRLASASRLIFFQITLIQPDHYSGIGITTEKRNQQLEKGNGNI